MALFEQLSLLVEVRMVLLEPIEIEIHDLSARLGGCRTHVALLFVLFAGSANMDAPTQLSAESDAIPVVCGG